MGHAEYTQSPAFFNTTTSLPSLRHIITTNPQPPDGTLQSHNSMSSRHVKLFSAIQFDLLKDKVVTFATSHRLRSPLKAEAEPNTVARKKADYIHSQRARKEGRGKNPDQNAATAQRRQTFFKLHTSRQQPKPPSEPPWIQENVQATLPRTQTYVLIWRHAYAGDTNQQTVTKSHKDIS